METFEHNGQGIVIETDQAIKAVEEGIVVFAGVKEPYGKQSLFNMRMEVKRGTESYPLFR